ncbi:tail fiber domain-containing protein [Runella salmonicolor]|uniref:Tail fiber domain-containing protein n=1 Tax=Runella salmonicolor TaxID=2950278 RepID=A0ABT1FSB0_9BACT|nr:tail fiber domain-containing protein [Runella salmonicolor]MCP1384629.1 tail fiber domain-containing protein [Runella salmonicolor]
MKKLFIFACLITLTSLLTALGQSTTILPGILLPQMTTAQRTALVSPQNGMLVYDTNTQSYWYRQGGTWVSLSVGGGVSNYWQLAGAGGNEIQNVNTGGFWSANPVGMTNVSDNTTNPPTAPVSGAGTRLMWIPSRSAFRAGTVALDRSSDWDAANIGLFSFATGYNTRAGGSYSTAMGHFTIASGNYATALGAGTTASGSYAAAIGIGARATGNYSVALGFSTLASGPSSTAMGDITTASGITSTAIGTSAVASGHYSTAMGYKVNTNGKNGSFVIGDYDPYLQGETIVGSPNQFVARFANGYWLMTCGDTGNGNPSNNVRTGIVAGPGANAWSAISDSAKKEKLLPIDGEGLLHKIAKFRLATWNYKGQDPKAFRHYGPMAQDFYAAFGKDGFGTIGCDTLINQADFDGINFAAIQSLVKRTNELRSTNDELRMKNEALENRLAKMEKEWEELRQMLASKTIENNITTETKH